MRISFDLDDTLICYGGMIPCEPRLPWPVRCLLNDEPLRCGARQLVRTLRERGHQVWIYTTSDRGPRAVRWWLRLHGVQVDRVVNGVEHARCFGSGSAP